EPTAQELVAVDALKVEEPVVFIPEEPEPPVVIAAIEEAIVEEEIAIVEEEIAIVEELVAPVDPKAPFACTLDLTAPEA
ncbi:unnamed protein product, partial [Polarella glacialis]